MKLIREADSYSPSTMPALRISNVSPGVCRWPFIASRNKSSAEQRRYERGDVLPVGAAVAVNVRAVRAVHVIRIRIRPDQHGDEQVVVGEVHVAVAVDVPGKAGFNEYIVHDVPIDRVSGEAGRQDEHGPDLGEAHRVGKVRIEGSTAGLGRAYPPRTWSFTTTVTGWLVVTVIGWVVRVVDTLKLSWIDKGGDAVVNPLGVVPLSTTDTLYKPRTSDGKTPTVEMMPSTSMAMPVRKKGRLPAASRNSHDWDLTDTRSVV